MQARQLIIGSGAPLLRRTSRVRQRTGLAPGRTAFITVSRLDFADRERNEIETILADKVHAMLEHLEFGYFRLRLLEFSAEGAISK